MKKSLLIYGNVIGIIVLGFLIFVVWTMRFNKPQVIEVMSRKTKQNSAKNLVDSSKVADKSTLTKTQVDSGINNSTLTQVDSSKVADKSTLTKAQVDSGINNSTVKNSVNFKNTTLTTSNGENKKDPNSNNSKEKEVSLEDSVALAEKQMEEKDPNSNNSEEKEVSLEDAVALAEKQMEEKDNFAKKIAANKCLNQILKDKLFIPYRGAKVVGPSGDEMPTTVAPKNLELVGICALGGQEGAMIVVPQRKQLDKADVLSRLKQVGSSEWAKWMVDHYMQGGKQRMDVKIPNNDPKTAGEWQSMMDEIFTEMKYNKVFFVIGDEVYDEFILTGLLADGVILTKGAQEYFLPMISNSKDVARRNKAEIKRQDKTLWSQYSYLYRQKRILQWRNWRSKYYVKQKSKTKASSAQGASYSFGQGASPKW